MWQPQDSEGGGERHCSSPSLNANSGLAAHRPIGQPLADDASDQPVGTLRRRANRCLIKRLKPSGHNRTGARALTICISALADGGKAVVCVADKMMSFGDYTNWDSDVTKIVDVKGIDGFALISGGLGECSAIIDELNGIDNLDHDIPVMVRSVENVYKAKFLHFQEILVLQQRGLSKEKYESVMGQGRPSPIITEIAGRMEEFALDCDIMLCGINKFSRAYIVSVASPGTVLDRTLQGFNSIGIGAEIANPRLLWSGYERAHSVGRVLFDAFDAKANAEMAPGVGLAWDAMVIFDDGAYHVPKPIRQLIESAWDEHNRSPFENWNSDENLPRPKKGWQQRILGLSRDDFEKA